MIKERAFRRFFLATVVAVAMPPAFAASVVTIKPTSGHPNLAVTLSGTGFGDGEAVDLYVDTVDTLLLVSSATGTLSGSVVIPASAQPGTHYVTAVGRHSGDAAQASFSVTTPWAEQGFGAAHLGWNPYENTLNTSNVGSLGILWQISANGLGSAPAVANGRVYVGTSAGLDAVSPATGAVQWTAFAGSNFYASPAVVGNALYIGDGSKSEMHKLNASTGAVIWSQATNGAFESSPVVVGGLVYAGGVDGKMYAFTAASGKIAWTYTTGGFIDSSPAVVNGTLYVGSTDDTVYALNAATGALIWSYRTGGDVESAVAVSNGVVYVGSDDDKVYAFSAAGSNEGALLWSYTTGGLVYSSPAVAKGIVYVGVGGRQHVCAECPFRRAAVGNSHWRRLGESCRGEWRRVCQFAQRQHFRHGRDLRRNTRDGRDRLLVPRQSHHFRRRRLLQRVWLQHVRVFAPVGHRCGARARAVSIIAASRYEPGGRPLMFWCGGSGEIPLRHPPTASQERAGKRRGHPGSDPR